MIKAVISAQAGVQLERLRRDMISFKMDSRLLGNDNCYMANDYFVVFDLPPSFELNLSDLEKRYFEAQRRFHPDRLVGKSPSERQAAIAHSMLINEAYEALRNPLKRAQYLLSRQGIAYENVKPSQELLMEIMELREALMEADTPQIVQMLAERNEMAKSDTLKALLQAFEDSDIPEAAHLTMRLSYLTKLEDEIRIRRKTVA